MIRTIVAHFITFDLFSDRQNNWLCCRGTLAHDHVLTRSHTHIFFTTVFINNIYRMDFGCHKIPPPVFCCYCTEKLISAQFIVDDIPQLLCFHRLLLYATLLKTCSWIVVNFTLSLDSMFWEFNSMVTAQGESHFQK